MNEKDTGAAAPVRLLDTSTLTGLLLSDLERYFFYNNQANRQPRRRDLWRSILIPRLLPLSIYRLSHWLHVREWTGLSKFLLWLNFYLHGLEISARCEIGPYFFMPHVSGTVIGATKIGAYAVIYHQVTLGAAMVEFADDDRPVVGDQVLIGSGAKVLGRITIGDRCRIGANSVVLKSVPPDSVAVGIPARTIATK
ncbi:serine O-acetyltransferase [Pelomonas sp. KK5]|uniref:serine O-acetyltransferase n=1 Tax=Pelomonas sp. KK5 TaxID=1855730 RepID=UPI0009F8B51C|nr:serine O-acetyltransferase [Pelomonas sp. KK5]